MKHSNKTLTTTSWKNKGDLNEIKEDSYSRHFQETILKY